MNKIKYVSLFFRILFQILFFIFPLILIMFWVREAPTAFTFLNGGIILDFIPSNIGGITISGNIQPFIRFLGFCISMIPASIEMLVLYFLIKLFSLYERNEIFSMQNVRYLKKIGYTLLIGQLINPLYEVLLGVNLTWYHHPKIATITFDGTNIGVLLIALLVILISWIMAEGCKLREEQQLTV